MKKLFIILFAFLFVACESPTKPDIRPTKNKQTELFFEKTSIYREIGQGSSIGIQFVNDLYGTIEIFGEQGTTLSAPIIKAQNGATGEFISLDNKLVKVQNGIIVSISKN